SGLTDAELTPIARTYDPTMSFEIGGGGDPRYEVLSPGTCGPQCHFKFSFLRSGAPVARIGAIADDPCNADEDGFCLRPTGLVGAAPADGFFHEFYVSGPPVPDEFLDRPWALTTEVTYCMSGDSNGCDDISLNNGGSFTFGLIMVPQ
ncbi:MAG: hypothetical protein KDK70_01670, partial [Myxococcales bacterium]|nr:hypothetical protein [Myxococcales bacterium]